MVWSGAAVFGLGLFAAAALRADDQLVPLVPKLPAPAFVGTPKDTVPSANVEPLSDKPRPPMMVPKDVVNLAPGKKITCSDANAQPDALAKLQAGDRGWERMVPPEVVKMIKEREFFGYRAPVAA